MPQALRSSDHSSYVWGTMNFFLSFFLLHVSFTEHTSIAPFQSEYYYFGVLRSTDSMNVSMKITEGDTCCFKRGAGPLHVTNRILLEINLHLVR